jgi:Cu/Ag efflux pump CusA
MLNNSTNSSTRDVIQTLRTAHQNQTQLNLMADQKANILIGTLVLMYTVVFTRILTLAEYSDQVMVPLASFIVLGIIPLVLTTLVLIPRNIKGMSDISIDEMPNPLFFGFFTKFSEKEYCQYMEKSLSNDTSARNLLVKDLYQIGVILKRKYSLLRMAYIFAMVGLVVPLLLWVIIYMENT